MFWLFLIILALTVVVDQANPQRGSVSNEPGRSIALSLSLLLNKPWLAILSRAARSAQLS